MYGMCDVFMVSAVTTDQWNISYGNGINSQSHQ